MACIKVSSARKRRDVISHTFVLYRVNQWKDNNPVKMLLQLLIYGQAAIPGQLYCVCIVNVGL